MYVIRKLLLFLCKRFFFKKIIPNVFLPIGKNLQKDFEKNVMFKQVWFLIKSDWMCILCTATLYFCMSLDWFLLLAFMKDYHLYWELRVMAPKAEEQYGELLLLEEVVKVWRRPLNLRLWTYRPWEDITPTVCTSCPAPLKSRSVLEKRSVVEPHFNWNICSLWIYVIYGCPLRKGCVAREVGDLLMFMKIPCWRKLVRRFANKGHWLWSWQHWLIKKIKTNYKSVEK